MIPLKSCKTFKKQSVTRFKFFNINGVPFDSNTVMFNYKSFDNQNTKVVEFEYLNNLGGKILYRYIIPNQGYLLNFEIETQGLNNILGTNRKMDLVWDLDSRRQSKSVDYENRYTYINYKDQDGKIRDLVLTLRMMKLEKLNGSHTVNIFLILF